MLGPKTHVTINTALVHVINTYATWTVREFRVQVPAISVVHLLEVVEDGLVGRVSNRLLPLYQLKYHPTDG